MKFRKIAVGLTVIAVTNIGSPTIKVFADEIENNKIKIEKIKIQENQTIISKAESLDASKLEKYNNTFKVNPNSIQNNAGNSYSYRIENAIDANKNTLWETNKNNTDTFKNEVVFTFDEVVSLDKMIYATRQDGHKGLGFPLEFEIYSSLSDEGDDFKLVSTGTYSTATGDFMQFKFKKSDFKRLKFKFVESHRNIPGASEFMFYKEDEVSDVMKKLFTDENKNVVSEEYRSIEKLNELETLVKKHPLKEMYMDKITDAKIILEDEKIQATTATTKRFTAENNQAYNDMFRMDKENIEYIKNNAGHYASQRIGNAIDGDVNTYWETNKGNYSNENETFTNEVEVSFKERVVLEKIVYGARQSDTKGFAEEFEVYASNTSEGDTYQLVATGNHDRVSGQIEADFEPTEFKRIKFKFKKSNQNWATLNELWFYKEDKIANNVESLFTDDTYTTVSEEFNTLEKIEALENEVKNHPLYNDFKEDIANAKALVSRGQVEAKQAQVTTFNYVNNETYNNSFKMDKENIKSIKNNGGHYWNQKIEYAIDGDLNTYWETNSLNTSEWKNEIEIAFNENVVLDRIVYGARATDAKGFAEEFEIYASPTTKGDTFELVATGQYNTTKDFIEAKFEPTEFKRVKFKFKKSNQNSATAREFMFYKEDKLSEEINNIFTDGTQIELKPGYDKEKINELEEKISTHPLKNELSKILDHAKKILENPGDYQGEIMQLERRGNSIAESQKRKVWNFQDWLPTGYRVSSGDVINVYVDVEKGEPTPHLVFKQMESGHNGTRSISLSPGKNTITIPEVELDVVPEGVPAAGVLYVVNPYTEKEQSKEPKIRFENLEKYPHYVKGIDNDEEVMKELEEYVELLKTDKSLPNVFDIFGDKSLMNTRATDALNWYKQNKKTPSYTADSQDRNVRETMEVWGFDGSSEINSDFNFRYVGMIKNLTGNAFMNAGNGIIGVHLGDSKYLLSGDRGWGTIHEMGHNFDTTNRRIVEVTNNILPLHFEKNDNKPSRVYNNYQNAIFNKVVKEDYSDNKVYPEGDFSNISHIGMMWQLALYDYEFYPKLEQAFRASDEYYSSIDEVHNAWATKSSDILKMDMTEHFERHGANITEETRRYNSQYPKLDKKTWYMNDNIYLNNASVFTDKLDYKIERITSVAEGKKLEFSINEEDKKNLIGYEIYRDDKLIGFTFYDNFIDKTAEANKGYEYKIVAFDGELNEKGSHTLSSLTPTLKVQQEKVIVGLRDEFDAKEYVKAISHDGENISKDIEISHNVDTNTKGNYTVEYSITDENITVKKEMEVEVVSDTNYASDVKWESATTGWRTVNKDKAVGSENKIKLKVDGTVKEFDKGIGVATNSEIVYNLEGKGYKYFTTYLGTDKNYNHGSTTIDFKILADGKEVYKSNTIRQNSDAEFVLLDLTGVKELKLVADSHDGNLVGDFVSYGDTKFYISDSKPSLEIEKSVSTKVGEPIENVVGNIKANDIEDGDLISSVVVSGHENIDFSKPGEYTITYTVTDSDNNTVTKERNISVVDMRDAKYITEYDWKSAAQSYGSTGKDVSTNGNKIRLTGENGKEVLYDRGIGAHSNATITYDLTDKNYEYFTSYVGVDRNMHGSVASITFEVYVDGEKKYDSGLMRSTDPQKFVEVDINGAKELRLVVTDGGNGIGSDHGSFGDAKLHFVNTERADLTKLQESIEKAEAINASDYTEESINNLNLAINKAKELLNLDLVTQAKCDEAIKNIEDAISKLEALSKVITIEDESLEQDIKDTLGISGREITLKDMHSLVSLTCESGYVKTLKGLEYAVNLESLNADYNEIKDISAIKDLKKLTNFSSVENYTMNPSGNVVIEDGKFIIEDVVIDLDGERLLPKQVILSPNKNPIKLDLNEVLVGNKVMIDSSLIEGKNSVEIKYESENYNYQLYTFTFLSSK